MSFEYENTRFSAAQNGGNDNTEKNYSNTNALLLDLLQDEDWNGILEHLRQLHLATSSVTNQRWSWLQVHAADVWSNTCSTMPDLVPIEFVQDLFGLLLASDEMIHQDFWSTQTALHMAVLHCAHRQDIVQVLLTIFRGSNIQDITDAEDLRPIDILTQRILMKEERLRYHRSTTAGNTAASSTDLDDCWESARLLAISHVPASASMLPIWEQYDYFPTRAQLPLLHACCLAVENVPRSLLERAFRRCPNEFMLRADAIHGNTPLHCVAAATTFRRGPTSGEAAGDVDTENDNNNNNDDLLGEVLRREPRAASIVNRNDEYPLDLAIVAGRTWESGCRLLLEAHPAAILHVLPSETNNTTTTNNMNDDNTDTYTISKRLLIEIFSKNDTAVSPTGGGGYNLTYSILHVIQPQVLFV